MLTTQLSEKYKKAPWRESTKELPTYGGAVCICYVPMYHCEMKMVFHRSRKDSGYKDFFTAEGRSYDYDCIKYWCYYGDTEEAKQKRMEEMKIDTIVQRELYEHFGMRPEGDYWSIARYFYILGRKSK